jgi:hypothetical protein
MPRPRSYSTTSSNSTFSINTLSSLPSAAPQTPQQQQQPHQRHSHAAPTTAAEQEMALGSMYDYLVKFILIGPSGCGKYPTPIFPCFGERDVDSL